MTVKKHRFIPTLFAAMALALILPVSCEEDPYEGGVGGGGVTLDDYTPLFKGTCVFLETNVEDVTLYQTTMKGVYYLNACFGSDGGLIFLWDKETNLLSVEESYTGLYNEVGPVYVVSQSQYRSLAGINALDSAYFPSANKFTFNIILEYALYDGTITHQPTTLVFSVKENL